MPKIIQILGFTIKKAPNNDKLQSYSIPIVVAPGATRVINLPTEFNAYGTSVAIQNTDAANAATAILNNDRINTFSVLQGSPVSLGNQWIVQLEITAGAVAATTLLIQVVPTEDVNN